MRVTNCEAADRGQRFRTSQQTPCGPLVPSTTCHWISYNMSLNHISNFRINNNIIKKQKTESNEISIKFDLGCDLNGTGTI